MRLWNIHFVIQPAKLEQAVQAEPTGYKHFVSLNCVYIWVTARVSVVTRGIYLYASPFILIMSI